MDGAVRMGRRSAARIIAALDGTAYDQNYDGVATLTPSKEKASA